ncbi:MAG: cytochrome c [Bdellovibrionota bacterium]
MKRKNGMLIVGTLLAGALVTSGPSRANGEEELFEAGQKVFKRKQCSGCHVMSDTELGEKGPGLKGIYKKRGADWLKKWLSDPAAVLAAEAGDPDLKKYKAKYADDMANPELKPEQLEAVLVFLKHDGKKPKGE